MAYQLEGTERVLEFLSGTADPELREFILGWIPNLTDPDTLESEQAPGSRAPVFVVFVPGTTVMVTFLVAEEFRTVWILEVANLAP